MELNRIQYATKLEYEHFKKEVPSKKLNSVLLANHIATTNGFISAQDIKGTRYHKTLVLEYLRKSPFYREATKTQYPHGVLKGVEPIARDKVESFIVVRDGVETIEKHVLLREYFQGDRESIEAIDCMDVSERYKETIDEVHIMW